jgi:methionyl-tRNA synthetase
MVVSSVSQPASPHHAPCSDGPATALPPVLLTTAIDYVNATPHIGHAYEKIATDALARYFRLIGRPVFFLTGVDEHGSKVAQSAEKAGVTPQAFCDDISARFQAQWDGLGLTYDRFIRTTDADHQEVVQWIWRRIAQKGDLYKASYTGLYCGGCERFLTEKELTEDGNCPIHERPPTTVVEENWFFRLSAYRDRLREHILAHPEFVQPDFRRDEVLNVLEDLQDISVSRTRQSVSWGIPVPDDDSQVIYVWIDALSNYITGAGVLTTPDQFARFWAAPNTDVIHIIGKDILRFHAIYWPAMLLAADVPLPTTVFAHGFINLNAQKISKSLGNVIAPDTLIATYQLPHADPLRYYLLTVAPFGQDGDFSEEAFKLKINADLANNLGNLLNRALAMTHKYFDGTLPADVAALGDVPAEWTALLRGVRDGDIRQQIRAAYESFQFHTAADLILRAVDNLNQLVQTAEPWNLYKAGQLPQLGWVLTQILDTIRQCAVLLSPITPNLSLDILTQLGLTPTTLCWHDLDQGTLAPGHHVQKGTPVLPRLDSELAGASKKQSS